MDVCVCVCVIWNHISVYLRVHIHVKAGDQGWIFPTDVFSFRF